MTSSPLRFAQVAVLLAVAALPAQQADTVRADSVQADTAADILVLHFNDFHGQILPRDAVLRPGAPPVARGGYPALAAHVTRRRAEHAERLWVTNGGDWYQGTPEGNEDRGVSVVAALDRLGITAAVLGNHEYDFGERHLMRLLEGISHPVLGANIRDTDTQGVRPYVRPYVVRTVLPRDGGPAQRVAIVGLITEDTPSVSTGPFGRAEFIDEAATLKALWPALQHDADHVVLLTHCGVRRDRELAQEFPDIALILGGHSHTALRRPVHQGGTTIVQAGSGAQALTEVGLQLRDGAMRVVHFAFVELQPCAPDPDTAVFLTSRFGTLSARWDKPLGVVDGAADTRASAGSTPGGNFITDLMRTIGKADVALTNKGGLRTTLATGPISRRQVFQFVPFDNSIVTVALRGTELQKVLAHGLASGRRPLEISGATYAYRIEDGQRVLDQVTVGGDPLDPDRVYRVATNSFLVSGGDDQGELGAAPELARTDRYLRDFMVEHVTRTGTVTLAAEARISAVTR